MIKRDISFNKGDSRPFKLRVLMANGEYLSLIGNEKLVFDVRATASSTPILTKECPNGGITHDSAENYFRFVIEPQDTEQMCVEKPYEYTIKFYSPANDTIITVVGGELELK